MKLNSRGVKFRAVMVLLAALAYLHHVWRNPDDARDRPVTESPAGSASAPASSASMPRAVPRTPEGGSSTPAHRP
jgi:hypothetical protein